MEEISRDKFEKAMKYFPERKGPEEKVTADKFNEMIKDMQNPVKSQKEIAVKVKIFLEKRIKDEMEKNGVLGDNTRKWVETYTTLLDRLQKAIHGDKSLNLHVLKISHGDIAARMRESIFVIGEDKKKKKKKESE